MSGFFKEVQKYNKLLIALLGAVLTTLSLLLPNNQWVVITVTFLTAIGVYQVPNRGV